MGLLGSRKKKHGLYYLLPGMTRANRVKRKRILWWSIAIGILCSGALAAILWYTNR